MFIKSGDKVKCGCGFEGTVYGTLHAKGGSAPWCPDCGKNNNFEKLPSDGVKIPPLIAEDLTEDQSYLLGMLQEVYMPGSNVTLGEIVKTIDTFVEFKINKMLDGKKRTSE